MHGVCLKLYVKEIRHHRRQPIYEWLLAEAKKLGIPGGAAFRAIAGFGHHGVMHEERFVELQGETPIEVEFVVTEEQADQMLAVIRSEGVELFYVKVPVELGLTAPGEQAAE